MSNGEGRSDKSLERLQEATKRGAEVLPATISGSTAEQPPLAVIPDNPAVVPVEPPASDSGATATDSTT